MEQYISKLSAIDIPVWGMALGAVALYALFKAHQKINTVVLVLMGVFALLASSGVFLILDSDKMEVASDRFSPAVIYAAKYLNDLPGKDISKTLHYQEVYDQQRARKENATWDSIFPEPKQELPSITSVCAILGVGEGGGFKTYVDAGKDIVPDPFDSIGFVISIFGAFISFLGIMCYIEDHSFLKEK